MIRAAVLLMLALPAVAAPKKAAPAAPPAPVAPPIPKPVGPDRTTPPPVAAPSPLHHADPQVFDLGAGRKLWFVPTPGARKVVVQVILHAGTHELEGWSSPQTDAASELWGVATTRHGASELAAELALHDINLSTGIGWHDAWAEIEAPKEELDTALSLLDDVLRRPVFTGAEVARYKRETSYFLTLAAPNDLETASNSALGHAWRPADAPYGARPDLTALKKLKPSDLATRHAALLAAGPVTLLVAGDLDPSTAVARFGKLVEGLGADKAAAKAVASPGPTSGEHLVLVDVPGATQASIRLRTAAPPLGHADSVAFSGVDWALGGAFLSRLNSNLREDKGWTYGIRSRYGRDVANGTWTVSVMVSNENVGGAVTEIRREIDGIAASGARADEIDAGWRDRVGTWNNTFRTAADVSGLYSDLATTGRTVGVRLGDLDQFAKLSPADTQRVAAQWFGQARVWVIAGDRSVLEPQLQSLGLTPTVVSPSDAVLGRMSAVGRP